MRTAFRVNNFLLALLLTFQLAVPYANAGTEEQLAQEAIRSETERLGGLDRVLTGIPQIEIDGDKLIQPRVMSDVFTLLSEIHSRISASNRESIQLKIDGRTIQVRREPLGQGVKAVVYSVVGSQAVIKIARPTYRGLLSVIYEKQVSDAAVEAMNREPSMLVPKGYDFHALGIYSIKERIDGPTLTEHFFKTGFFVKTPTANGGIRIDLANDLRREELLVSPEMQSIARQVESYLALRKKHPTLIDDIGPSNFILRADGRLAFVDLGPASAETSARYDKIATASDFFHEAMTAVNRYLQKGSLDLKQVDRWIRAETSPTRNLREPTNPLRVKPATLRTFRR